ncbi:MAG: hypothetical protein ACI4GO_08190 [Hominenteromicrobium sp.]
MLHRLLPVFLSVCLAVFSGVQVHGAQPEEKQYAIRVLPHAEDGFRYGETIGGKIRITAALKEMDEREDVIVQFVLSNDRYTCRATVVVTPENIDEDGLFSASASFENLLSGVYTLRIERADGASLSYILAEKGSASKYTMEKDSIRFYLSAEACSGSAWFMMQEKGVPET